MNTTDQSKESGMTTNLGDAIDELNAKFGSDVHGPNKTLTVSNLRALRTVLDQIDIGEMKDTRTKAVKWDLLQTGLRNTRVHMNDHGYAHDPIKRRFCRGLLIAKFFVDSISEHVDEESQDHRAAWHTAYDRYANWRAERIAERNARNFNRGRSRSRGTF